MLKQSKTQISLIGVLGLMIIGQAGFVIYQNFLPIPEKNVETQAVIIEKKPVVSAGSAKAFGLNRPQETYIQVGSVKELGKVFNNLDYTLAKAKSEGQVPRLFLSKLPQDMKHKKRSSNSDFIQVLLPHILRVNEQILSDRERLLEMQERKQNGQHLRHSEKMWLSKLASEYRCKSTKIESLLMHVDIVPPSLALAQAILETGGGRSHAALKKNSPFGHMANKKEVAKFESIQDSVKAYAKNLNRNGAYSPFRKERASLRAKNQTLCGYKLASRLTKYSVRGPAYTRDLQNLIHSRGLKAYDSGVCLKP